VTRISYRQAQRLYLANGGSLAEFKNFIALSKRNGGIELGLPTGAKIKRRENGFIVVGYSPGNSDVTSLAW
jgi:hypothetical protein